MLTAWVAPTIVPRQSIFGRATGAQNAALITGAYSGETGIFGVGAGGDATAVAILGDLAAIARDRSAIVPAPILTSDFVLSTSNFGLQTPDFVLAEAV
jgi:homoserine dehydrogenase